MPDMRTATLKLVLDGLTPALKSIDSLKINLKNLTKSKQTVGIDADTAQAMGSLEGLTKTIEQVGDTSTKSSSVIVRSLESVRDSAKGVSQSLTGVLSGMKGIAAGASAAAVGGVYMATGMEQNVAEIRNLGKEYGVSTAAAENYINTASKIPGLSKIEKSSLMLDLMKSGAGQEDAAMRIDAAAETLRRNRATLEKVGIRTVSELLNASEKQLTAAGIAVPGFYTEEQAKLAQEQTKQQFHGNLAAPGFNEQYNRNLERIQNTDAMNRLLTKQGEVVWTTQDRWDYMNASISNVTSTIGSVLIPVFDVLLTTVSTLLNSLSPLSLTLLAVGAGGVVAAGAIAMIAGQVAGGISAIISLVTWMGKLNLLKYASAAADLAIAAATKVATAAQWLLNVAVSANPIGAMLVIVVALAAGLYLLADHFGLVEKATDWLKNFDLSKAIDSVKKFIGNLTGGDLGKMVLTMMFPPVAIAKMLDPIVSPLLESIGIQGGIYGILDGIYSLLKRVLMWIFNGLQSIVSKLVEYLGPLVEKLKSILSPPSGSAAAGGLKGDDALSMLTEYNKTLPAEMQMSEGYMHGLAFPDEKQYVKRDPNDRRKILESIWSKTPMSADEGWENQAYASPTDEIDAEARRRLGMGYGNGNMLKEVGSVMDVGASYVAPVVNAVVKPIEKLLTSAGNAMPEQVKNIQFDDAWVGSPGMATGGEVLRNGFAKLHQGEQVLTANEVKQGASGGNMTFNATFNINGVAYSSLDKMKLKAEIEGWIRTMTDQGMTMRTRRGIA